MDQRAWGWWARRAVLGAVTVVVLWGAAPAQVRAAETIAVGALRFTSHAPGFIAFEKGYFSARGASSYIRKAQGLPGVPPFTDAQIER